METSNLEMYFSDKFHGKFPSQKKLNEAITDKKLQIQTKEANPLTIRLLATEEAISNLENEVSRVNKSIQKIINENEIAYDKEDYFFSTNQTYLPITAGSAVAVTELNLVYSGGSIPFQKNRRTSNYQPIQFRNVIAHLSLYSFFSNYASCLDRFSSEINKLFTLDIDRVDWNILCSRISSNKNNNKKRIKKTKSIPTDLLEIITKYNDNYAKKLLKYRNRFVHDGLIHIKPMVSKENILVIYLQSDPDIEESEYTIDGIKFCKEGFSELLETLDESYLYLTGLITTKGQPPW